MGNKPTEAKKPAEKPAAPAEQGHAKGGAPAHGQSQSAAPKGAGGSKIGCLSQGCKEKDHRLSFCDEHFKQFKFGLITKFGEKVLDYEKKFEHYQRWLKAQEASRGKVA